MSMFSSALRSSLRTSRPTCFTSRILGTPAVNTLVQRRLLTDQARAAIQKAVTDTPLVLFMKGTPDMPQCGFSRAAIQVLDLHGVPPEKMKTYNVLEDQELREGIKEFSQWPTIPQLYINGEFIGGCDILLGMHQSGELENLLEKENIIPKIEEEKEEAAA
ncbi:glutaredoxin-like protein [Punctularia strigosozonata HHB-11173 SS5]|uniref:Monothiol glutaredoxin-5, mitochondrial n=1 Tax=Punctularia strigosozonata (strain HHB-11173) TaxID=741275 RepID=R7S215_PUNST|nr:glutaredoxin-like protein [Punctularia strigosozonata HHB-11173 SS5]EIN03909.1 glutaredoxin-like protein [Punctularia strigosozonata HHB-11173 SS5]